MRKKVIILIACLLLGFFINPYEVKAELGNIVLTSPDINKTLDSGDVVTVHAIFGLNSEITLTSGRLAIRFDEDAFELLDENNNYYDLKQSSLDGIRVIGSGRTLNSLNLNFVVDKYKKLDKEKEYTIMSFKFKVKDNVTKNNASIYTYENLSSLKCLEVYNDAECIYSLDSDLKFKIDGLDNNSKLQSLNISNVELLPEFNENKLTYASSVKNNIDNIKIEAQCAGRNCQIEGLGNKNLKVGSNYFTLTVTSEASTTTEYDIIIFREEAIKSSTNTLKSLTIGSEELNFDPTITSYQIRIPENIQVLSIKSELTDPKSKYVKDFGNRAVDIKNGLNEILIKVEAENGDINTYRINVIRGLSEEEMAKITDIAELKIKNHDINFSNEKNYYELEIANNEKELDFDIELVNEEASYQILNNSDLENNKIVIVQVTSADKTVKKEYEFKVKNRSLLEETLETNSSNIIPILIVVIVLLTIAVISLIVYIIVYKKKNLVKN